MPTPESYTIAIPTCLPTSLSLQKSKPFQTKRHSNTANNQTTTGTRAATNRGLAKVAVQCSADTFEVNQTLVLRINPDSYRDGEKRHFSKTETDILHIKNSLESRRWKLF
jgi:hypothetical protein